MELTNITLEAEANRHQLAETHRCTWDYPWVYERWDPR